MNGPVTLHIAMKDGTFVAFYSERGLSELHFPTRQLPPESKPTTQIAEWHKLTTAVVQDVLAGTAISEVPPLDLGGHTDFRRKVWAKMCRLQPGETIHYGELATRIGSPAAARAVGGACGANPIPLIIPCHRVLAANRVLGGFSGGLEWKRRLLAIEGSLFIENPKGRGFDMPDSSKVLPLFEHSGL